MVRFFRGHFFKSSRRASAVILAFALVIGVLFGGICSGFAEPALFQLMRTASVTRVSIVCLLPVLLFPVAITAFVVYIDHSWLLIPLVFTKAFLFSFLCAGIVITYPDSGPLFAVLFLFTDWLSLPVLCWCWFRCFCSRNICPRGFAMVVLLILGIGLLDYQIVSPFLTGLLS